MGERNGKRIVSNFNFGSTFDNVVKCLKILFFSSQGVFETSNQNFWSDGKRPLTLNNFAQKKGLSG